MKKVLLSLVAFLMIFNTVFAEEVEILENQESTTIVEGTINNEENTAEVINNEPTKEIVLAANEDVKTYVAKIGDTNYETLDEAINNASNSDTIELLDDTTLTVGEIKKGQTVTIKGNGFKITVPRQNSEEGYLAIRGTLNLYNTKMYFTRTATEATNWSTYLGAGSFFNLYNSELVYENIGIYADAVATINLDKSKMALSNMKYTAMMSDGAFSVLNIKNKSEFTISNPMDINGITGFNINVDNSTLNIKDCKRQGMVYGSLKLTNHAKANFINCTTGINLYNTNEVTVDGTSELYMSKCAERAIISQSRYTALIVKKGGKLTVTESGYAWKKTDDESIHYASKGVITMGILGWLENRQKLYIYRGQAVLNFEDGAIVNITNNYVRGITFSGANAYIGNTTTITNNGGERVAVGGGIYNLFGNMTISKDAKIYNNHANTSSDDIYNSGDRASITFTDTGKDWILDDCDDKIDGWYDDNNKLRWNAHDKDKKYVEEVKSSSYETELTLKAAHGIYGKLIVRYVDTKGNVLNKELTYSEKVDTEYATIEKEFEDYSLVKVDGETKGKYIDGTIIVTYIYEYTSGTGGNDVPETGINANNALEVTTALSMITLVSAIILRKRFKKLRQY